jgi:hypothetical protein
MDQGNVKQFDNYVRGFESDSPESNGEKITTFLLENPNLEFKNIKYGSYRFPNNLNRETSYSALLVCSKK